MSTLTVISEKLKNMSTTIASIFGIIASIGGAVLYVENNYAHAEDVKTVIRNQTLQINQTLMFQLDYYDSQIKKLESERTRNAEILADPTINRNTRAYTRKPEHITEEIVELKERREKIKKDMISK